MLRAEELRGGPMAAAALTGSGGQRGALLSVTATGPEGTARSCVSGQAAGGEGKGLHQRAVGMEQLPRAVGRPGVPELREHLDSALRHWVWTLGGPAWSQQMDSGIFSAHLNPINCRFIFSRFACAHYE